MSRAPAGSKSPSGSTYLDHNATTPVDPRVVEVMQPYLSGPYANPSSPHRWGRAARDAVETARAQVGALVGAAPGQVVFTSGGTEANNLAVKGVAATRDGRLRYSAVEHPCVYEPMQALARSGRDVSAVAVDADGRVEPEALRAALSTRADANALWSCMWANNETGVLQDVPGHAATARSAGAIVHCDAVQAAGKLAVDFGATGAQLMSLSSHKIFGPKGAGALVVDDALELEPLLHGGGQERGLRGGTENVASLVGFGAAADLAARELASRTSHLETLRELLEAGLDGVTGVEIFARRAARLPNTVQFAVPGVHSATLLGLLDRDGFAVSSGSACATGTDEPSPVLRAMGVAPDLALCAIRVSLGKDNTADDVERFTVALATTVSGLRPAMASMASS